jgi:hypothetical protein
MPQQVLFTPTFTPFTPVSNSSVFDVEEPAFQSKPLYKAPAILLPSQKLLNDVLKFQMDHKEKIERLFQSQKAFMTSPQQDIFNALTNEQRILKEQLESVLNSLLQGIYHSLDELSSSLQDRYFGASRFTAILLVEARSWDSAQAIGTPHSGIKSTNYTQRYPSMVTALIPL